jgi:hypothetical protein
MRSVSKTFRFSLKVGGWLVLMCLVFSTVQGAGGTFTEMCPTRGIQPRSADFKPGGIILAAFDRSSMWVYNIDADRRYPLPNTQPCGTNCRLSRDARWITFVDSQSNAYAKMRLDGTERTPLVDYAADVEWWSADTLALCSPLVTGVF